MLRKLLKWKIIDFYLYYCIYLGIKLDIIFLNM